MNAHQRRKVRRRAMRRGGYWLERLLPVIAMAPLSVQRKAVADLQTSALSTTLLDWIMQMVWHADEHHTRAIAEEYVREMLGALAALCIRIDPPQKFPSHC